MDNIIDELAVNLAANLRYLRERRGFTQERLGTLCGIPRSTLANLETGSGNPTLAVLGQLAMALQISLEELLSAPRGQGRLHKRESLPIEKKGVDGRITVTRLLPDPIPGMEILRMELPACSRFAGVPHRPGTREYIYCEEGELALQIPGQQFTLSHGDVCSFQGDQGHTYINEGENVAIALGVVVLAPL